MVDIQITEAPLNPQKCFDWTTSNASGCVNIFVGTVRSKTNGRGVKRLEFETYEKMAISEMQKIVVIAKERWRINNILVHHRIGILHVGEIPVIIAISASHRKDAIEATKYTIDTLKNTVPIWKKEVYEDGEEWVSAHP